MTNQVTKIQQKNLQARPALPQHLQTDLRVPPADADAEAAIIGAILLEERAYDKVADLLQPDVFYTPRHSAIYFAITLLAKQGVTIDSITVMEQLRKTGELEIVGGAYELVRITNDVTGSSHIVDHALIILEKYVKRQLAALGAFLFASAYQDTKDVLELKDEAEKRLFDVSQRTYRTRGVRIAENVPEIVAKIEKLKNEKNPITGVPTGWMRVDQVTRGWQAPDLIIIAARPAVGKTAFALNIARAAAKNHIRSTPVAFFSLEMSDLQLTTRLIANECNIPLEELMSGQVQDSSALHSAYPALEDLPIYIDDTASLTLHELRSKLRLMKMKNDIGLAIIDYLQLMSGEPGRQKTREQEVSEISRGLKILAKELSIPIIALSQLSRSIESRSSQVPKLSDLRESGSIEQDADIVIFLSQPSIEEKESDASLINRKMVSIAKHRNGTLDDFKFEANLRYQRFEEIGFTNRKFSKPNQQEKLESTYINPTKKPAAAAPPLSDINDDDFPF